MGGSMAGLLATRVLGRFLRARDVRGPKMTGTGLVNRYVAMVHRAVMRDTHVYGDFLRVLNLLGFARRIVSPGNLLAGASGKPAGVIADAVEDLEKDWC
jgi:hypothetical protein